MQPVCARVARNRVRIQPTPSEKESSFTVTTFARTYIPKQLCSCESHANHKSSLHSSFSTASHLHTTAPPAAQMKKSVHFAPARASYLPKPAPLRKSPAGSPARHSNSILKKESWGAPTAKRPLAPSNRTPPNVKIMPHVLRRQPNYVELEKIMVKTIPGLRRRVKPDDGRLSGLESLCSFSEL